MLLDGKLVEEDLVVSLVEVVQELELIVGILFHTVDLLNRDVWRLFKGYFVALIERKHFLLFSFKFSTQLSSLKNLNSQLFKALKSIHAGFRIGGEISESSFFLVSGFLHGDFEFTVMIDDLVFLTHKGFVSIITLFLVLLSFKFQKLNLLLQTVNLLLVIIDVL